MPSKPLLYLGLGVAAAMAALLDYAGGGFLDHGYLRLALLAFIAAGSISLSALIWEDPR